MKTKQSLLARLLLPTVIVLLLLPPLCSPLGDDI